jgi:uncharacterized protein YkwD
MVGRGLFLALLASVVFLVSGLCFFFLVAQEGPMDAQGQADYARNLIEAINSRRQSHGLAPLAESESLNSIAAIRAEELKSSGLLSITRPDGTSWSGLLAEYGLKGQVTGENHSIGNLSPWELADFFLSRPEDRQDILYPDFAFVGAAARDSEASLHHVAVIFLTPAIDLKAYRAEILTLVNRSRKAEGLSALAWDEGAARAAQIRAGEILSQHSHERPGGSPWRTVLMQLSIPFKAAGENIALGQRDAQAVMTDWMNSPGHRANILRPEFTSLGVGAIVASDGRIGWTQIFLGK